MRLGALEAGGTKMVCAIGDENGNVFQRESYPTREPENTIPEIINYFKDKQIEALGIGSFGPLCLDVNDPKFGYITTTPKPGWSDYPLRGALMDALGVPVGIDTDVNAAALAEARIGAGKGLDSLVYYTIGTGVGAGLFTAGQFKTRRSKKFRRLLTLIGDQQQLSIPALASALPAKRDATRQMLESMIDEGLLGERAYIDYGRDMLILDGSAVQEPEPVRQRVAPETELGEESAVLSTYDISFINTLTGKEWHPKKIVRVKLNVPDLNGLENAIVYHLNKDGKIEFLTSETSEDMIAFNAIEFSVYGIAGMNGTFGDLLTVVEPEPEDEGQSSPLMWLLALIAALALALLVILLVRRRRETDE